MGGSGYHVGARLRRTTRGARMVKLARFLIPVFIGLWSVPASATFTGLIQIPIAYCLDPGRYELDLQWNGRFDALAVNGSFVNTQFGLAPRVEAGVDFDLTPHSGGIAIGNIKYLFAESADSPFGAAVGVSTLATDQATSCYVVGSARFSTFDGHVGVLHSAGENSVMLGYDQFLTSRLILMADYISGSENYSAVGVVYEIRRPFFLQAACLIPNQAEGDLQFQVLFTLFGPFSLK